MLENEVKFAPLKWIELSDISFGEVVDSLKADITLCASDISDWLEYKQ